MGKRDLSIAVEKPSGQEASVEEDFPSPQPLYTPTTAELEQTLDNAMADTQKKPALPKSLSLSIDKPTDQQAEEEEPPVDVLPTPSAKEVEKALEADMKGWKEDDSAPKTGENENGGLSKSQKKKAKKKAKKGGDSGKDDSAPSAYMPGSKWEPDDDEEEDYIPPKPAADSAPAPAATPAPPTPEPAPAPKTEPEAEPKSEAPRVPAATPARAAEPKKEEAPTPKAPAPAAEATKPATAPEPTPEAQVQEAEGEKGTPEPSKLDSDKLSIFANSTPTPASQQPSSKTSSENGSTKKWATVPAPVSRTDLKTGQISEKKEDSPAPKAATPEEADVPEPKGPIPYENLLAGNPDKWPKGVRFNSREKYLSDEEFQTVFKMTKDEFANLKSWKKTDLKKAVKLF
mmetsp:Transcript_25665/g.71812  ORF Transcript_25665/g.71812 Transcript_25665/m.71812 type:complete len:401 (+) Transcript_25665:136-1338(+)